ncbi:odorant receptor 24a-like [Chironomus tepperi]|uniref:odorant receptor 24a-like n=1 Tax=Chironomus tepperi TaxID=113505 RepID=UPI00391F40C4
MLKFLRRSQFESPKTFFRVQKFGWHLMGFWLGSDEVTQFQMKILLTNCFVVLIYGIFQGWFIFENRGKLVVVFDAITPFLTQIPTVLRLLVLVWRRKELKYVLDYLKKNFTEARKTREIKVIARANQISSILLAVLVILGYITLIFFFILPVVRDFIRIHTGSEWMHEIPFKAIFPFEYNYFPMYEIVYFFNLYSGYVTMAGVCAGEGMFFGFCAHLAAQFDVISLRLEELIEQEIGSQDRIMKFSREQNDRILNKLTEIVDMHNKAIDCCNIISKALWQNILMHFVCSSLTICICSMMILKANGIDVLIFIFYLGAYVQQIFNYSISGNMLINASTNIQVAAYEFHWYKCDIRVRKTILMIIIRAQQKVQVEVPFFEVSLETFAWIIRLGGSFIALVKTFL